MLPSDVVVPTFTVIGAMKGGTSALHNYLGHHPEVCMTSKKECNFFVASDSGRFSDGGKGNYGRGVEWYRSLFREDAKAYGDVSPEYGKRHRYGDNIPQRLHEANPDVRIIYLLRDPIARVISGYVHNTSRGWIRTSFSEFIRSEQAEPHIFTSCYHYQLEPYLRHFSLDQFLLQTSEELKSDTSAVLQRIFTFIGVSGFESEKFERRHHVSANKTKPSLLEERVGSARVRRFLAPVLPGSITERRPIERPEVSEADRVYLADRFSSEVEKLRALTGQSFEAWSL